MPVEDVIDLITADMIRADPALGALFTLDDITEWMNGIQYYLGKPLDIARGHLTFVDAPWALTALCQGQFWADRKYTRDYGDGTVVDCLSVDEALANAPDRRGDYFGVPAVLD